LPGTQQVGGSSVAGLSVRLKLSPVQGVGADHKASWLSSPRGQTVADAPSSGFTRPDTPIIPFTVMQYWRDSPNTTRQLDVYRVTVTLDSRSKTAKGASQRAKPNAKQRGSR
jgi:hypothetical protein